MADSKSGIVSLLRNRWPQTMGLILWFVQLFLMLDPRSFILSMAYPLPFQDGHNENYILFFIVYSILFILFFNLASLKPYLGAVVVPGFFLFEAYCYASPLIEKYLNLPFTFLQGYAEQILNPSSSLFWSSTAKCLALLIASILLFISLLSKKKSTVIILFLISAILLFGVCGIQANNLLKNEEAGHVSKSIAICFFRVLPILPLFFTSFRLKK